MNIRPIKTSVFTEGEDLIRFITGYVHGLKEGSVLAVTSKIVALAERRIVVVANSKTKEKLIRKESDFAVPGRYGWLTVKDGAVLPSAGIDESNANGKLILLPKDSFRAAEKLRSALQRKYRITRLGILITDSRSVPFRSGITGVALGYAGFCGAKDYRGKPDIFGRKFKYSKSNAADALAAAAVLTMGEGNERQPIAIIEGAPIEFCKTVHRGELYIDIRNDLYFSAFSKIQKWFSGRRAKK